MSFKISGLGELSKQLKELEKEANKLEGSQSIPFSELFHTNFMNKYTNFNNIDEMFEKSGFKCTSNEDFEKIPDSEWNDFVKNNTNFSNWENMKSTAGKEYVANQLGL